MRQGQYVVPYCSCSGFSIFSKVWDVMSLGTEAHMPKAPTYTLQTSFPVRRVLWRIGPAYECELAIVSNAESSGSGPAESASPSVVPSPHMQLSLLPPDLKTLTSVIGAALDDKGGNSEGNESPPISLGKNALGDPVEIWDVRRGFIAKWRVRGSANEGGVTGLFCSVDVSLTCSILCGRHRIRRFAYYLGRTCLWFIFSI